MVEIFLFFFGLSLGSFLNSVIFRLETGGSFFRGRSFCPNCQHILSWQDLIPIFSFLILKGKCRYCQQKISWQYPLVELATGILFVLLWNYKLLPLNNIPPSSFLFPPSCFLLPTSFLLIPTSFFLLLISCFLIIIFVYDLKHYLIPDKIIYLAIGLALFYQFFKIWNFGNWNFSKIFNLILAILPSLFFLAIILISRGSWMGMGDFKLAILMGLFLGWPNILVALFFAFLIGAIIGLGLIIAGKKTLKSKVPFGPFLVTGTFVALFWGETIISWYLFNLPLTSFSLNLPYA